MWKRTWNPDTRDHSRANYRGVDKWVEANQGKHFCHCGCGGVIQIKPWMHFMGITKYLAYHCQLAERTKKALSRFMRAQTGPDGHNWRGGLTKKQEVFRKSKPYVAWRKAVFARDNYTCQHCNNCCGKGKSVYLHAHHSPTPFKKLWEEVTDGKRTKDSLLDVALGVTLCRSCHHRLHRKASSKNSSRDS